MCQSEVFSTFQLANIDVVNPSSSESDNHFLEWPANAFSMCCLGDVTSICPWRTEFVKAFKDSWIVSTARFRTALASEDRRTLYFIKGFWERMYHNLEIYIWENNVLSQWQGGDKTFTSDSTDVADWRGKRPEAWYKDIRPNSTRLEISLWR